MLQAQMRHPPWVPKLPELRCILAQLSELESHMPGAIMRILQARAADLVEIDEGNHENMHPKAHL